MIGTTYKCHKRYFTETHPHHDQKNPRSRQHNDGPTTVSVRVTAAPRVPSPHSNSAYLLHAHTHWPHLYPHSDSPALFVSSLIASPGCLRGACVRLCVCVSVRENDLSRIKALTALGLLLEHGLAHPHNSTKVIHVYSFMH